jgi:uncharacterized cupin superfamily protein
MPKIDIDAAPLRIGTDYPPPHDAPCQGRRRWRLGDAAGLDLFGVSLLRLPPGQWSCLRHWHSAEDEFVFVVEGEVVLVEDDGETVLRPGDCAGFKAGVANGHHLENRSDREAVLLEMGSRRPDQDTCTYADIDMVARAGEDYYRHRDGTPYPEAG